MTARTVEADAVERRFLVQEHRELVTGLARVDEVAQLVGRFPASDLGFHLGSLTRWLESVLEPHTAWEDAWLYPRLEALAGSAWPARILSYDHAQIRQRIERLELERAHLDGASTERQHELLPMLYGLEALIRAHIDREERFLLPLLEEEAGAAPAGANAR